MEILKKFIKDNNLKFEDGNRNAGCITLSGFAIHNNLTVEDCKNAVSLDGTIDTKTSKELERTYTFASNNNYGNFWSTDEAKAQYTF